jgi:hypothetical protein
MLKLYCQKCGALNAYISEKPNFCQKCGDGFNDNAAAAQNSLAEQEEIIDEEVQEKSEFNINALEIEIEVNNSRSPTLGSIMGTGDEKQTRKRSGGNNPQQPYTMDDFKEEAGNINRGGHEAEET